MTETLLHTADLETSLAQVSYAEATFLATGYDVAALATSQPDQLIPTERQQAGLDYLRTAVRYDTNYSGHPASTLEMLVRNKYALAADSARAYAITSSYLRAVSEDAVTEAHTHALRSIRPGLVGRSPLLQSAVAQAWDGLAGAMASAATTHKITAYKQLIESVEPPHEPLHRQLLAAAGIVHKLDTAKTLSPREDLNPLCELTEKLAQNTAGFEPEDVELHTKVTGSILRRVNDAAPGDNSRRLYKSILVAMGGEVDDPAESIPAQKARTTPVAEPEARQPKASTAPVTLQKDVIPHSAKAAEVTVNWTKRRLGAAAALAAAVISPIAEAGAAFASPAPTAAGRVVVKAPLTPGAAKAAAKAEVSPSATTATEGDTAIIPTASSDTPLQTPGQQSGDVILVPSAQPSQSSRTENVPTAPGTDILTGTVPPHTSASPTTSIPIGSTSSETIPTLPGVSVTVTNPDSPQPPAYTPPLETIGTSSGTRVDNPSTVSVDPGNTTGPSQGQNILVTPGNTTDTSGDISGAQNAAGQTGTDPGGNTPTNPGVQVSVPGNAAPNSPTIAIEPANPQTAAEQSSQDSLEFYLQNGSSSDVIQQYGQMLADKYQLTPAPDSAFLDMVNTTISQVDNGKADMNLVLAGVIAKYPAALTQLGSSMAAATDSPFVTLMASTQGLGNTEQGLAGLDGQVNYSDDTKITLYTLLARGLADNTTDAQQTQMLEAMGISGVTVTATPPPAPAPQPPAPTPTPATPKSTTPKHSTSETPVKSPEQAKTYRLSQAQLDAINKLDISSAHKEFLKQITIAVMNGVLKGYHISPEAVISQAINETGWGSSTIAREGFNLFGTKAGRDWKGKIITANGTEQNPDGSWTDATPMYWKAYSSYTEAIDDYAQEIGTLDWYDDATHCNQDPYTYLLALENRLSTGTCRVIGSEAAWATDHSYVDKTMNYVKTLKLPHLLKIGQPYVLESVGHPSTNGGTPPPHEKTPIAKNPVAKPNPGAAERKKVEAAQAQIAHVATSVLSSYTYNKLIRRLEKTIPGYDPHTYSNGEDCAFAVGTIIRSIGIDKSFPYAGTVNQYNYMTGAGADKWERVKNTGHISDLKPGDVFSIGRSKGWGGNGHTFIYIGEDKIVSASLNDHGPQREDVYFFDSRNPGGKVDIFRYVG